MPIQFFTVSPGVSTSPAYSTNDVVGGTLTFSGLRRGSLQTVTITDKSAQSSDYRLVLFNDTPTNITDNATYDVADADLTKIIRSIPLTAATHRQAFTDNAVYIVAGLDIPVQAQCPSLTAFLIATASPPTYASTSDISVVLQVDTDYVSGRQQGSSNISAVQVGDAGAGELGGTYPSPTVNTTHSGSTHANLPAGAQVNSVDIVTISGVQTLTNKTLGATSVTGQLTLADGAEINLQEEIIWTAAGPATTAADYSIARDDSTVLHLNVPTGATFELSVNDVAVETISPTILALGAGIEQNMTDVVQWTDAGPVVVAADYSIGRNDSTVLYLNVPLNASMIFGINNTTHLTVSSLVVSLGNSVEFNLSDKIQWTGAGPAVVGADYSIGRDNSTVMHLNVPNNATYEMSINDSAKVLLTQLDFSLQDAIELKLQEDLIWTAAGPATTAAEHSISRDDANVLHLNVPTGATYELSINDVAAVTLSATALTLANAVELNLQEDIVWTAAGAATTAGEYSYARDDSTVLHANVPTGATYEWSVNDVAELTLAADLLEVGGLVRTISGDATAPSHSFTSATGSGMYRLTNNIGFSVSTANVATMTPTGVSVVSAVSFPATQVASAVANDLDDYEEGVFTATIMDDTFDGSGESQAYNIQIGRYQKVGNRVNFEIYVGTSSLGTLTTTQVARIGGLPFVAATITSMRTAVSCAFAGGHNFAAIPTTVTGRITSASNYIVLEAWDTTAGVTDMLLSEWSADGELSLIGHYQTA